jgi:hypothetical protein
MGQVIKLRFGHFSKRDVAAIEQVHRELSARGLWGPLKIWKTEHAAYAAVFPPYHIDSVDPLFLIMREPSGVYYKTVANKIVVAGRTIGACLHASVDVHNTPMRQQG